MTSNETDHQRAATPVELGRDRPSTRAFARLGDLTAGPLATLDTDGAMRWSDGAAVASVRWWVGAEDQWHRVEESASLRRDHLKSTPVALTSIRVPSGEVTMTAGGVRVPGLAGAAVGVEILNDSPIPVALGVVIESNRQLAVHPGGVEIAGLGRVHWTREALGYATAPSLEELFNIASAEDFTREPPGSVSSTLVCVMPLPHTATLQYVVETMEYSAPPVEILDRTRIPQLSSVVTGWRNHLGAAGSIQLVNASEQPALERALTDVAVGPGPLDSLATVAGVVEARARFGLRAGLTPSGWDPLVVELLDAQRRDGGFDSDDRTGEGAAAAGFVAAAGALWCDGLTREAGEQLLFAVAAAVAFLSKRRRSLSVPRSLQARVALASVLAFDLDQEAVGRSIRELAESFAGPPTPTLGDNDGGSLLDSSIERVLAALDSVFAATAGGVAVGNGWDAQWLGRNADAQQVPTPWGRGGVALRWHGDRPALLWEIEPWPGRHNAVPFLLTAPVADPAWSSPVFSGDALLAAQEGEIARPGVSMPVTLSRRPGAPSARIESTEGGTLS